MKIDIWSDIRCPFCYIGKRKFEMALELFAHKDKVTVTWHSFQLDPNLKTQPGKSVYDYLAEIKGLTREETVDMHEHVTDVASQVGLDFNFDRAIVANSFMAHRFIQLAKAKSLGNEAEEQLFKAHFTDGKNIDEGDTLLAVGRIIGIAEEEVQRLISSDAYSAEVKADERAARDLGIRGVPFFIFNDKFAVSGAQAPEFFLQVLEKAWREYENISEHAS